MLGVFELFKATIEGWDAYMEMRCVREAVEISVVCNLAAYTTKGST